MLDGNNAQLVAIVGASAVAFVALYISYGPSPLTTVALLGTLSALALTVLLATVFTDLAHFTGAQNEDALLVSIGASSVNLKSLVLAGMVLGALGALNDITVTQASAVGELRTHNPTITRRALYRSGLRIGRDHISSTVNTLALAYAGASLPLLMLFTLVLAEPRHRRQRRGRRRRDRRHPGRQHRPRRRGAGLDRTRRARHERPHTRHETTSPTTAALHPDAGSDRTVSQSRTGNRRSARPPRPSRA